MKVHVATLQSIEIAPARKLVDLEHQTAQEHKLGVKIQIFENVEFHDPTHVSKSAPSFQICLAILHYGLNGKDETNSRKIRLDQTNSQISKIRP